MSNDKHDHNDPSSVSRADALLSDYFEEMFTTTPENAEPSAMQSRSEISSTSVQGQSDDPLADREEGTVPISEPPQTQERSKFQHPNLKPASAILESRQVKPFKDTNQTSSPVVAGLMPKLKSAPASELVQQSTVKTADVPTAPEVKQATEVTEEVSTVEVEESVQKAAAVVEPTEVVNAVEPEDEVKPQTTPVVEAEEASIYAESEHADQTQVTEQEPPAAEPPVKTSQFRELAEFEMLLFEVRGLQLAVPLISLGSIHRLEDDFTPIVGRADWYLGMYSVSGRNLQVVDTARWVMPSRVQVDSAAPYEFVIRLADTNWALACSGVQQAIRIGRDEIKWRTQSGKRPWLAGTVISKMCALLDVESMADLLDQNKLHQTP